MGDSSRRSRSRSPSRKHKDRGERSSHHSSSRHHHKSSHRQYSDEEAEQSSRRHKRDKERDETEEERKDRKRLKKEKRRSERAERDGLDIVDDDDDGAVWVEKGIDTEGAVSNIPTADSLPLTSQAGQADAQLPHTTATGSQTRERDSWMLDPGSLPASSADPIASRDIPRSAGVLSSRDVGQDNGQDESTTDGGGDFFSSLGTEHKRKDTKGDELHASQRVLDRRELNTQLKEGKSVDEYEAPAEKKVQPGGPGYQWRMMKLKRLYEQAEEQVREVEDVALERYGSLDEFNEALEERRVLDQREQRRQQRRGGTNDAGLSSPSTSGMRTPDAAGGRRYMFTNEEGMGSRPSSRAGFRRPGEAQADDVTTPGVGGRLEELKRREGRTPRNGPAPLPGSEKVTTPIPSVFTPTTLTRSGSGYPFSVPATDQMGASTNSKPPMSIEALNKLQAKVLRAKLMEDPNAEELEEEYERERERAAVGGGDQGGAGMWEGGASGVQGQMAREVGPDGKRVEVQVLPTLDGRGQLYDVGTGSSKDDGPLLPGNKRKKQEKFETRDREGNVLRYNADDDEQSLGELVRQERFGAGRADQKNIDAEMAAAITTDARFDDNLDYMDDNAERLAQRKRKSDAMKRAFAINDFARTKKALDNCPFCYQDDRQPLTAIVALGQRTYLCCTQTEELVPGHCLIVPLQHHLSSLEMEDDDWEEVRNFMKCLMKMHAKDNKGVLFFETCLSFKQQRHTYIEAVPMPFEQFQDAPAYFRESILASESEWTQHKKLIDFSSRPGGFRRMLVPNLPYFMVQWDYKGEKGYGHIIEGVEDSAGRGAGEDDMGGPIDEDRNGGEFPKYFAGEIIGNLLGLEPRKWRKPRRMDTALNKERARALGTKFQPYNWTAQLQQEQ